MNAQTSLGPMLSFKDIVVVPFADSKTQKQQISGPIWPDWESQTAARHCRYGMPIDKQPVTPKRVKIRVNEPLIWAGNVHKHFGHYISEYASRILQSLQSGPKQTFLFGCHTVPLCQSGTLEKAPSSFLPVVEWLGLNRDQIRFCTQTMRVANLSVAPQAEQIVDLHRSRFQLAVPGAYLDLLDENTARNKISPPVNKTVFVSRAELPIRLEMYAGSKYLDSVLRSLGVFVFHPEKFSLREQLSVYSGAEQLVFSEGSALHGLQLLGRGLGSVSILNRRKNAKLAEANLNPRCRSVDYINAIDEVFAFRFPGNSKRSMSQRVLINQDILFAKFAAIGIDLAKVWNAAEYQKALEDDLTSWIIEMAAISRRRWRQIGDQSDLVRALNTTGFKEICAFAQDHIAS